ncbi:MAG: DUF1016 N-terminal domain-containing protein [Planctomycetota bacterium]
MEQRGERRADYGKRLLRRLSTDLSQQFGRGFSERSIRKMRQFYLTWPQVDAASLEVSAGCEIWPTASAESGLARSFPLPWSHYVALSAVADPEARRFYEREALCGGWTIRQLGRQIGSQFFELGYLHGPVDPERQRWRSSRRFDGEPVAYVAVLAAGLTHAVFPTALEIPCHLGAACPGCRVPGPEAARRAAPGRHRRG